MKIHFYKYQGTGNDFIMIDNRSELFPPANVEIYRNWCDRRFGIGADGLILLQNTDGADFRMVYFNSDGNPSSMCGNGGRCIARFAADLGIIKDKATFIAADGLHQVIIEPARVSLKMNDVKGIEHLGSSLFLNTGSPHYVEFCSQDIIGTDIVSKGRAIRNSERFKKEGTNVNFVNVHRDHLYVRTYERGVEDETYSCGTGVTAVAIAASAGEDNGRYEQEVHTAGGILHVSYEKAGEQDFHDIWLKGPAEFVFEGDIIYP